jgi:hypothetical protein
MDDGSIIVASFSGGIVLHDSLALPPLTSGSLTVGDVRVFLAYFYPTYFSRLWSVCFHDGGGEVVFFFVVVFVFFIASQSSCNSTL